MTDSPFLKFLHGSGKETDFGKKRYGRRAEEGSAQGTHNFMPGGVASGSYVIDEDDEPEFYRLYCDHLRRNLGCLTLTEKSTRIGALRVDLDFIYGKEVDEHQHTREQVVAFVKSYMAEVKKLLTIDSNVEVFVMEKPAPTYEKKGDRSKSGVHIVVPQLKTNRYVEEEVRRVLLKDMDTFFPGLKEKLKDDWKKVYDQLPLTHTTNWTLLGSRKAEGAPYELKYIIDWNPSDGEVSIDDDVPIHVTPDLVKKFSVRSSPSQETPLTDYAKDHIRKSEEESKISGGRAVTPARGRPAVRGEQGSRSSSPGQAVYQQPLSEALFKYYSAHAANLSHERFKDYKLWIDTGICLKNIHPDLESVWMDFSAQDERYNPRETIAKWNGFGFRNDGNRLGVGSLLAWSRTDNLNTFMEIEKTNIIRLVKEASLSQTEGDVAQVVHAKYHQEFKCARFSSSAWYRFRGHTWQETDKGVALQARLSNEIAKEFLRAEIEASRELAEMDPCSCTAKEKNPECEWCKKDDEKKKYMQVRNRLKTSSFTENVMKMARLLFLDEEFANKVDENHNLIAFNNGVLDTLKMEFRDGKPEDYVSFSTNLDYDPDKPYYEHECWSELQKFINDVLPDTEVRTYFLACLSTTLSGCNEAQKFHILTGNGSNGKSMLMNLMMKALGDYATKASVTMLTQGRGKTGSANPDLIRLKGKRFATMSEPDDGASFNSGYLKELTSSEPVTARDLYAGSKQMVEFIPQVRFFFSCNDKPVINTQDGGTWRRVVVVDYPNKFVVAPKLPNEKPMDESIQHKVVSTEWATCFLSYLVHLYREGNGHRKLVPPTKIMACTSDYKDDNDAIAKFIREFVHPLEEVDGVLGGVQPEPVTKVALTMKFQEWKRANDLFGAKGATAKDLEKRLAATYGAYPRSGWTSFRFGDA
jgi:P4 family phage/plasmid primase-like protien